MSHPKLSAEAVCVCVWREIDMEKGEGHIPHVLILPFPAQGHITPLLQFSKRLIPKGIKVTLVTTTFISKSMHVDPNSSIAVDTISDGYDAGGYAESESDEDYLTKFRAVGSQTLGNLIHKYSTNDDDGCGHGHKISALIYDGILPWALDVAKKFGIMGVAFLTQSCAANNIYYHVNRGILQLPLSGPTISVPGLPPLGLSDVPSFVYRLGLMYHAMFDSVLNQFSNVDEADWVLFNTFYKLEEQGLDWMSKLWRLRTIGPTIPSMYLDKRLRDDKEYGISLFKPNRSTCINWLNNKPSNSVVYVSFGSVAELQEEQMEELAWGLKKSNYYFLWVVRASEKAKLPKNIMEEENTSEKGLVVTWSPQLEVLAHASIGCFVTHCGFNSVLEALSLGVPMVAMPQWTDQCTNGKYVEDVWGVGVRVWPDEKGVVRREVMESCIREVMEGEKGKAIKENAMKWRNMAKEAVDEGGSSDKNIDEFVAALQVGS